MKRVALVVVIALIVPLPAWSGPGPPANDGFRRATRIEVPLGTRGTSVRATMQRGEPRDCVSNRSVWYRFTVPQQRRLVINVTAEGFSAQSALYTGSRLRDLHRLACFSYLDRLSLTAEPGVPYVLQVGVDVEGEAGPGGPFRLVVGEGAAAEAPLSEVHAYAYDDTYDAGAVIGLVAVATRVGPRLRETAFACFVVPLTFLAVCGSQAARLEPDGRGEAEVCAHVVFVGYCVRQGAP